MTNQRAHAPLFREDGVALIAALMVMALLTTLAAALTFLVVTDTAISANYRAGQETLYAADAGIERALADVRQLSDWSDMLLPPPAHATSGFVDGEVTPRAPDGRVLDLAQLTSARQAESDAAFGGSPDRPQWRLFAHAPVSDLVSNGSISTPAYVVVWVADDVEDGDGDPSHDANGVVIMRAEAFGSSGARRAVDARAGLGAGDAGISSANGLLQVSWREVR